MNHSPRNPPKLKVAQTQVKSRFRGVPTKQVKNQRLRNHYEIQQIQGRKNSININFLVRISRGHSWPLRPDAPGSKSFSPSPGPQKNALFGVDVHDFRCGRPWPEGFSKNFVRKKFALIFWPLQMAFSGGKICGFSTMWVADICRKPCDVRSKTQIPPHPGSG